MVRSSFFPHVFIGNRTYDGIRKVVNEPGTDDTVRWAGCALNSRKISLDLTSQPTTDRRYTLGAVRNVSEIPVVFVDGLNHATILADPPGELVGLVDRALQIDDADALERWTAHARAFSAQAEPEQKYQEFVVHAVDDCGDPITDHNVEVRGLRPDGDATTRGAFDVDVHPYTTDPSYRCFHVDLTAAAEEQYEWFRLRVIASTGTDRIGYLGFGATLAGGETAPAPHLEAVIDIDVPGVLRDEHDAGLDGADRSQPTRLFYPFTTTLVEIKLGREPLPPTARNQIYWFLDRAPDV